MKKIIMFFLIGVMVSCAPFAGVISSKVYTAKRDRIIAEENSKKGREEENLKRDQLSTKKLKNQSVTANPIKGFKGKVANFDNYYRINIIILGKRQGAEKRRAFLLGPGEIKDVYLLPGDYTAQAYIGGRKVGDPWNFKVDVQDKMFLGEKVHWYVYYDN